MEYIPQHIAIQHLLLKTSIPLILGQALPFRDFSSFFVEDQRDNTLRMHGDRQHYIAQHVRAMLL